MDETFAPIRLGLVDPVRLRRDCVSIVCTEAGMAVQGFDTVAECCTAKDEFDVLLFSPTDLRDMTGLLEQIAALGACSAPIIVIGHHDPDREPSFIRNLLNNGVKGYIAAASLELSAALAAIRFVKNGGTFAPMDRLLNKSSKPLVESQGLTGRQVTVLNLLRQGKPNKIIAYELGMSESTVKVHVRNIMRRLGATNRTQAVYKAEQQFALAS